MHLPYWLRFWLGGGGVKNSKNINLYVAPILAVLEFKNISFHY